MNRFIGTFSQPHWVHRDESSQVETDSWDGILELRQDPVLNGIGAADGASSENFKGNRR